MMLVSPTKLGLTYINYCVDVALYYVLIATISQYNLSTAEIAQLMSQPDSQVLLRLFHKNY